MATIKIRNVRSNFKGETIFRLICIVGIKVINKIQQNVQMYVFLFKNQNGYRGISTVSDKEKFQMSSFSLNTMYFSHEAQLYGSRKTML